MYLLIAATILLFPIILYVYWIIKYHESLDVYKYLGKSKETEIKILIIYPHPDDESAFSGGLISQLSKKDNIDVTVASITHGEKGDEFVKIPGYKLALVRKREYLKALNKLGPVESLIWHFKDGEVSDYEEDIKEQLKDYIVTNNFELVVTYEKNGPYPHPDHMSLSRIIHELSNELKSFKPLYSTIPVKIYKLANMPNELHFGDKIISLEKANPANAKYKLSIYKDLVSKYKALSSYKSQNIKRGMPLWFKILLMPYEYYTDEWEKIRQK
ncbi:MAG: PIG-L family deacetylase [Candidatus Dojkabacteria bacterium]|nr:PIG-L family deacetylase [Candidatus Dojkabacteria bacterium]MDQ7021908.1 PIG-L family deacetylase [Candidatus Dojkabacteria bacterium]